MSRQRFSRPTRNRVGKVACSGIGASAFRMSPPKSEDHPWTMGLMRFLLDKDSGIKASQSVDYRTFQSFLLRASLNHPVQQRSRTDGTSQYLKVDFENKADATRGDPGSRHGGSKGTASQACPELIDMVSQYILSLGVLDILRSERIMMLRSRGRQ